MRLGGEGGCSSEGGGGGGGGGGEGVAESGGTGADASGGKGGTDRGGGGGIGEGDGGGLYKKQVSRPSPQSQSGALTQVPRRCSAQDNTATKCPKCLTDLSKATKLAAPEVKLKGDENPARLSEKGVCKKNKGQPHIFKFGRCAKCGMGEGEFAAKLQKAKDDKYK